MLKPLLISVFVFSLMSINNLSAADIANLKGKWTAKYLTVSPARDVDPGPRFNNVEWELQIIKQIENVFWGTSKWRVTGRPEWNEDQVTGSVSLVDPSMVKILEMSREPEIRIKGVIDGTLKNDKLYVSFRGMQTGTSFSTILEKE